MKHTYILTLALILGGCNSDSKKTIGLSSTTSEKQKDNLPVVVALRFINSYVDNCNKMKESIGVVEWVNSNAMTTNRFKTKLKKIVEEA